MSSPPVESVGKPVASPAEGGVKASKMFHSFAATNQQPESARPADAAVVPGSEPASEGMKRKAKAVATTKDGEAPAPNPKRRVALESDTGKDDQKGAAEAPLKSKSLLNNPSNSESSLVEIKEHEPRLQQVRRDASLYIVYIDSG
jgi:hypothetical protein